MKPRIGRPVTIPVLDEKQYLMLASGIRFANLDWDYVEVEPMNRTDVRLYVDGEPLVVDGESLMLAIKQSLEAARRK